nr:hypothetical protein [Tanacetum cinerariifolium]
MALEIIYLATNQKFNFSRYILLSIIKNIEARVPFFMFPRFVQLLIDHQLGDMSHHKDIYANPSLTKKVFANLKRVGAADTAAPVFNKEKSFKQGRIIAEIDKDVEINLEEAQAKLYKIDLEHPEKVLSMRDVDKEEPAEVEEVLQVAKAAKLMTEVVTTVGAATTAETPKVEEVNEEVTLPEKEVEVKAHKREGKSFEKEVTKKQRMDREAEDLKSHLQIVANDDDDVYTEATSLA